MTVQEATFHDHDYCRANQCAINANQLDHKAKTKNSGRRANKHETNVWSNREGNKESKSLLFLKVKQNKHNNEPVEQKTNNKSKKSRLEQQLNNKK